MTRVLGLKIGTDAPAGYAAAAVEFDGTNDSYTKSSGAALTGTKTGILSVWIRSDAGAWPTSGFIFQMANAGGTERVRLDSTTSGRMSVVWRNAAGTQFSSRIFSTSTFTVGVWYHILMSWDFATTTVQAYLSTAGSVSDTIISTWNSSVTANDTVETCTRMSVGATGGNATKWAGLMADLYVTLESSIDLTVEANRRKFISAAGKPVDLGADGSTPTGTAPDIFMSDTWAQNLGSAGTFTVNGAVTTAATSPSD